RPDDGYVNGGVDGLPPTTVTAADTVTVDVGVVTAIRPLSPATGEVVPPGTVMVAWQPLSGANISYEVQAGVGFTLEPVAETTATSATIGPYQSGDHVRWFVIARAGSQAPVGLFESNPWFKVAATPPTMAARR